MPLLENDERHNRIVIEFISNNQYCTAEQIVDGVYKDLSRVTVYRTLKGLNKGIVQDKATNRRDHKFFVDVNNPLIFIPQQLEEIQKAYKNLLKHSQKYLQNMEEQELTPDLLFEYVTGYYMTINFYPAFILRIIIDSLLQHSTTIWITKYRDKDTLNQLFTIVFMKFLSLNSDYAEFFNNIRHGNIKRDQFKETAYARNLSPLQLMYISRKVYKKIGMEKEIDEMLDLLWKFNEDIRKFLFPEIEFYKWGDVHDWRNLLEIYENHPDQTAHNFLTHKQ